MRGQPLHGVRLWSADEVAADVGAARAEFRARRLGEPLQRYLDAFDAAEPAVAKLIAEVEAVLAGGVAAQAGLRELWGSDSGRAAFRYLGAPPISDDDLKTLAEVPLSAAATGVDQSEKLLAVMRVIVDPRRFPWLAARRPSGLAERQAATVATTALLASQRVQTLRRGDEKSSVEGAVKGLLIGMGWTLAATRPARGVQKLVTDAPLPRTFLTQTNLGADNADVIVRLDDGRLLAIECKGSNSEINSRKRLNKEAVQNARAWLAGFGADQVVPAVALQGVFNARYVVEAQGTPMAVYWSHRLADLRDFIEAAHSRQRRRDSGLAVDPPRQHHRGRRLQHAFDRPDLVQQLVQPRRRFRTQQCQVVEFAADRTQLPQFGERR